MQPNTTLIGATSFSSAEPSSGTFITKVWKKHIGKK